MSSNYVPAVLPSAYGLSYSRHFASSVRTPDATSGAADTNPHTLPETRTILNSSVGRFGLTGPEPNSSDSPGSTVETTAGVCTTSNKSSICSALSRVTTTAYTQLVLQIPSGKNSSATSRGRIQNTLLSATSDLPSAIRPKLTPTSALGSVPIQIGFSSQLNYDLVAENITLSAQVFQLLPQALTYSSMLIPAEELPVHELIPYDTKESWGYITTLAKLYYPSLLVDKLQMDLLSPNSYVYNNKDPSVRNLTAWINPAISLRSGTFVATRTRPESEATRANNDPFASNQRENQTSKQRATTAGVAIAAVSSGALFGAFSLLISRRYRRKKQVVVKTRQKRVPSGEESLEIRCIGLPHPDFEWPALLGRSEIRPQPQDKERGPVGFL